MPKVSVLLTSYNHEKYLRESIDSILNQTYKDFELYIVDDASTDNSWNVIKGYKDERIIAIRHKQNTGQCMTKELIKKFKGDYIAIAHCDDKWEKDKLKQQVNYLEKHKDVAACFTHVKLIDEEGEKVDNQNEKVYTNFNIKNRRKEEWLNYFFTNGNRFCHPSVLLRKKVQVEENLHVYGMGAIPDLYRWVKLLLKYDVHIIEKQLTCFRIRINGANTSGKNPENIIRNYFDAYHLLDLYRTITDKNQFTKIFPQAKKYLVNNDMVIEYAFSRICIEATTSLSKTYTMYGLNLLYETLQNDSKRKKIEKLYHYTPRDFKKETGAHDFYGVINKENFLDTSIYYQKEGDFTEDYKKNRKVYIDRENNFYVKFEDFEEDITKIRIDLDEDTYRAYKELKIYINGKEKKLKLEDAYYGRKEIIFLTTDPQIQMTMDENLETIEIKGNVRNIPVSEIENLGKNLYKRKFLSKIKNRINRKKWNK